MIKGATVHFIYDFETEAAPIDVEASISDYYPMCQGDPGDPAEGGEVEELVATRTDGTDVALSTELVGLLSEIALEEHANVC